jgi:hypothetical protein
MPAHWRIARLITPTFTTLRHVCIKFTAHFGTSSGPVEFTPTGIPPGVGGLTRQVLERQHFEAAVVGRFARA